MKLLLASIFLLSSFSAFSFHDEYFFYRYNRKKPVIVTKTESKKDETVKVEVESNVKPSAETAHKICYGLGYVSAASFKVEISADGKLTRLASVRCK